MVKYYKLFFLIEMSIFNHIFITLLLYIKMNYLDKCTIDKGMEV